MTTFAYFLVILGAATVARTLMRIIEAVDKQWPEKESAPSE